MNGTNETTMWRILDIVMALCVMVALGLSGWGMNTMVDLQKRITAIEASRFTSRDGLGVYREISAIREDLASLPREIPPAWFIDRVDKLEHQLATIQEDLRQLKRQ